ncbi:RES family NAD+ phosphorylase [Diaphorobacter caeni]|uniref:RES family NAD+ phosphorylase n=1 Tax=Diaphorobacter caeni TaxID=2784387 RepID=UPI00188E7229|nr:RES family NAD+ phosphorylase [Diaphorobacter caeni]MBF5005331.1 RES family NAD+ phosphorylase [Diaphorobacter caeni]
MTISAKQVPKIELPAGQVFHRVQRNVVHKGSVKINRMILPPAGIKAGRFCLATGVTAYLADSIETALYEAVFRRELKTFVALEDLRLKALGTFTSKKPLRLVDLRGFEEQYPVLQSQRIQHTQSFAEECFGECYDGILYASAQHPHHECVCLFETGAKKLGFVQAWPLVKPGTDILHRAVVEAARRSGMEIT